MMDVSALTRAARLSRVPRPAQRPLLRDAAPEPAPPVPQSAPARPASALAAVMKRHDRLRARHLT